MRNTLHDLNNYLFAELEEITDNDASDEVQAKKVKRAETVVKIADKIIENGKLCLAAVKVREDYQLDGKDEPEVLRLAGKKQEEQP